MFVSKSEKEREHHNCEEIATVKKCLNLLSEDDRIVVLAYYYDNLSLKEIAEVFEISEETVKSRLYLARKHLVTILGEAENQQGYKFFAPEITMIMLALDDIMNSNIEMTKADLSAKFMKTCSELS